MLSCGIQNYGALVKDGMDKTELIIQCEHAGEKGHQCDKDTCGSLQAKGTEMHATAIGNIIANRTVKEESGFSNLTIKGGIINAQAGEHNCAIGAACGSYANGGIDTKQYAKNIRIEGGIITAKGGTLCAGIGGGKVTPVDGIYITGGTVYASGGKYSPGIGSGGAETTESAWEKTPEGFNVSNIVISGGSTLVKAVGDKNTSMPGIGCGKYGTKTPGTATNICAVPDSGYQGYIQDGTSETEYDFTEESPFQEQQDIKVDKYFTMVYFGPFRDENKIDPDSKEQLGANHVISKTGGEGFTDEQIKELTKANGKDKDGIPFDLEDFTLPDRDQINVINEAKKNGEIGDYPLTIATEQGTQVVITVSLRGNGTDVTAPDSGTASGMVGANNVEKETGGEGFGVEEIKELCGVKGKDKDGNNLKLEDFKIDEEQLKAINQAKTSKNTGKFLLTYETPEGEKVTVEILLTGTVEVSFDTDGGSEPPQMQTADSGKKVQKPEDPVKAGYVLEGWYYTDKDGNETEWNFGDPVYENMTLKAKWKEEPKRTESTSEESGTTAENGFETEENEDRTVKKQAPKWEYQKRVRKKTEPMAKTGDSADIQFLILILGISLVGIQVIKRSRE